MPTYLLGNFMDDYGIEYSISDSTWTQTPGIRFDIMKVDSKDMFILGYNPLDSTYTKIEFMLFQDQLPYAWGFCYSTYDKKDKDEAISGAFAKRETPKTGCNGFPFSRMKPAISP
jgi:hypothetical protein